jgi:hypothetical protein
MHRETQTVKVCDLVDKQVTGVRAIVTQRWREKSPDVVWERTLKSVERRYKEDVPWLYVFWEPEDPTGLFDRGYKGWNEEDYDALERPPTLDLVNTPSELLAEEDEWIAPVAPQRPASLLRQVFQPLGRDDDVRLERHSLEDELAFDDDDVGMRGMHVIA